MRTSIAEVQASFARPAVAEAAAEALAESGVARSALEIRHGVLPEERVREGRFIWRVLIAIILWSIVGAVPGAAFGWLLAETIGPEGTAGLIVQVVCWLIVGHLLAGMLAGYALLADRSQREMPPDRPISVLCVHTLPPSDARRVWRLLRASDALEVRLVDGRGPNSG